MEKKNRSFPAAAFAPQTQQAGGEARKSAMERRVQALKEEEARLRELYPGFTLRREMENPLFVRLVQAGVDMRAAYEFVHRDAFTGALIREVAEAARTRALREKEAKDAPQRMAAAERPAENGTGGRAPAALRARRPSEWSREERERVGRAALRGRKRSIEI